LFCVLFIKSASIAVLGTVCGAGAWSYSTTKLYFFDKKTVLLWMFFSIWQVFCDKYLLATCFFLFILISSCDALTMLWGVYSLGLW